MNNINLVVMKMTLVIKNVAYFPGSTGIKKK